MKTILVPIDLSRITDRVVAEALDLSRAFEARLILLHVTEPVVGTVDYAMVTVTIAQANEVAIKSALTRLAALQEHLLARGATVETRHILGEPEEEILNQAASLPADYLVVGAHGHGRLNDVLVGSTTHGLLKRALCPVLVVPARMPLRGPAADTQVTI